MSVLLLTGSLSVTQLVTSWFWRPSSSHTHTPTHTHTHAHTCYGEYRETV